MKPATDAAPARPGATPQPGVPLAVDLDGTLVRTDLLMESLVDVLRRRPWLAAALPFWLVRGRAAVKRELARRAAIAPETLPYDEALLAELRRERDAGRRLVLATAADEILARPIAAHLGLFDEVIASDGQVNLKGPRKAEALVARFGERGFDYAGNDAADTAIWARAREALVAGAAPARLLRAVEAAGTPHRRIARSPRAGPPVFRALRAYQWSKNLLVFVPVLTAHRLDAPALLAATLAFVAFSAAASAVYLANDLADLEADRRHPSKRRRALAAGQMGIGAALAWIPLLLAAAAAVALLLPWAFGALLAAYLAANLAYTLWLKRHPLTDVFVLAGLYTLRILAGAAAIAVPVSHWLLGFSLFLFLSLALAKRYVEVGDVAEREESHVGGRGYGAGDGQLLGTLGIVSGYLSVLVFALYITSREVEILYRRPALLWFIAPLLLYGITRLWFFAYRRRLHEDPLLFALRDPASYALGAVVLAVMAIAT